MTIIYLYFIYIILKDIDLYYCYILFIFRILHYVKNNQHLNIIDPTPEKKWLKRKAIEMGWIIKSNESFVIEAADPLLVKGNYGKDDDGWSQSIVGLPRISGVEMDQFFEETTRAVMKQGTKIKKHFNRGEQFLTESILTQIIYSPNLIKAISLSKAYVLLVLRKMNAG